MGWVENAVYFLTGQDFMTGYIIGAKNCMAVFLGFEPSKYEMFCKISI